MFPPYGAMFPPYGAMFPPYGAKSPPYGAIFPPCGGKSPPSGEIISFLGKLFGAQATSCIAPCALPRLYEDLLLFWAYSPNPKQIFQTLFKY